MSFPLALTPITMLSASNVFMTFAWYGHLRYGEAFRWNHAVGFGLIAAGAFVVFHKW